MRRGRRPPNDDKPDRDVVDRSWSTRTNMRPRDVGKDVVRYMPLPAETGPTWAPDRLSIWPVEGGRYGIDAHYHGETGAQRARHQRARLGEAGLSATVRSGPDDATILRLGPLAHQAAWLALEAFLGAPADLPPVA
jgi:hypothetical protein